MKYLLFLSLCCALVVADVYMHNPRGSNNRNCRNDNNDRRRNGNRLFDSQNNDKGGYSCPRAYPFPEAANGDTAVVNEYGRIVSSGTGAHVDTDMFFYYEKTKLSIEWTNQHGCGSNENLDCRIVLQYMCDTDAPSNADENLAAMITNRYLRDGTPVNNNDNDNTNDEATTTIPQNINDAQCDGNGNLNNPDCSLDGRFGYMESHAWYDWCEKRERNYGLFTADQLPLNKNNRNRAKNTRQNPGGTRRGLECPEERDYYPYWTPTMWKDIAIGVPSDKLSECRKYVADSQNVVDKCYCDVFNQANPTTPYPNNEQECTIAQGTWKCAGAWDLPAPECFALPWTRDNHLGNTVNGYPLRYNWTLPTAIDGSMKCVLRMRYNTTTGDFPQDLDRLSNCNPNDNTCTLSPIADRNNREELTYLNFLGAQDERYNLSVAVNTNQYARTFQDRSYVFEVRETPSETKRMCQKEIVNINVRGKRGNIVQTYPSVEYDFVPQDAKIEQFDCVHMQWIGSDYNPNRNPNNAEGGPPNPNNENEAKADRSNLVQMADLSKNHPQYRSELNTPFFTRSEGGEPDTSAILKFGFIDQNLETCLTIQQLKQEIPNNRQQRERDPRNCGKLSAAKTPYFKGGVYKVYNKGSFKFMSTRNNNFSNRSQKLKVDVGECTYNCDNGSGNSLSDGQIAGIVIGSLAGVGLLGFAFAKFGPSSIRTNAAGMVSRAKPAV